MNFLDTNNLIYINKARKLNDTIVAKYELDKKKSNSTKELANQLATNTMRLGKNQQLSNAERNKILGVCRNLNLLSDKTYVVSDVNVEELDHLINYFDYINKDKQNIESELEKMLRKLSIKSIDAIINKNEFDDFKEYLHVERNIDNKLLDTINDFLITRSKGIIFVVGNVGDGKSHSISYLYSKNPDLFIKNNIHIHNDATETDRPNRTAVETLMRLVSSYSNSKINDNNLDRLIIAINLGVLTNFMKALSQDSNFSMLYSYLKDSHVLDNRIIENGNNQYFRIVSFTQEDNYQVAGNTLTNNFFVKILDKVFSQNELNPFYKAYKMDKERGIIRPLHHNFEMMWNINFRKSIIYLLTRIEFEYKIIISARNVLNFIYDILMPRNNKEDYDSYLPFLLFENQNGSEILSLMSYLDPVKMDSKNMNKLMIELYQSSDYKNQIKLFLGDNYKLYENIFNSIQSKAEKFDEYLCTFLRLKFLENHNDLMFNNTNFNDFVRYYSSIKANDEESKLKLFKEITNAIYLWNGNVGEEEYIISNPGESNIKVLIEVEFDYIKSYVLDTNIILEGCLDQEDFNIIMDFHTYDLVTKINNGYILKNADKRGATSFEMMVEKLITGSHSKTKNILLDIETNKRYELRKRNGIYKLKEIR